MRFVLLFSLLFLAAAARAETFASPPAPPSPQVREYVIVSGGPALRFFERGKRSSHDLYWGNFIRGAQLRIKEIVAQKAPQDRVTWMVFRPGYERRGMEMEENLLPQIVDLANKEGAALFWFDNLDELLNYLNAGKDRRQEPILDFEYFGHSNKNCFLFDYSNNFDAMALHIFHARSIGEIDRDDFASGASAKSWGCHTGEYFSDVWKRHLGFNMIGAVGKTDYANGSIPVLSSGGHWNQ